MNKKDTSSGCCGHPRRRIRVRREEPPLPPNPTISGGVHLLYLGSARQDFRGSSTGLTYTVSDRRRAFVAHPSDVNGLLRKRFMILEP